MEKTTCDCELRDRQWNGYGKCLRCGRAYVDERFPIAPSNKGDEAPTKPSKAPPKPPKPDKGDEDLGNVVGAAARAILADPSTATTKRVAWAYGCIRPGTEEEGQLLTILKSRLA